MNYEARNRRIGHVPTVIPADKSGERSPKEIRVPKNIAMRPIELHRMQPVKGS